MLRSLELFGFKSFADRTLFEFAPGISCVVGPNGSGKSNVVDALKWLLGDQSAKSLRGQEMSDVIFNGSAGRRPSGFAEATLTFDNSQGLLPTDAIEVRIGRRLYASGDSEYLLNGAVVRLKDVRDLFMGTGAGTAAYSIIEQGRVDQILQANPTTRRFVFEEASGISKFKSRRVEAERRLERVAQNLVRLTDLVDQAESQLNATRSQASKAARFRDLSQELKAAWTGLAADDTRRIARLHDELQAELEQRAGDVHEAEQALAALESQQREAESRLAAVEDEFLRHEQGSASIREQLASAETAAAQRLLRCGELDAELPKARRQALVLRRQISLTVTELVELRERLAAYELRFHESRKQIQDRERQVEEYSQLALSRKRDLVQRQAELASLTNRADHCQQRLAALDPQLASLADDLRRASRRYEEATRALESATSRLETLRQEFSEAESVFQQRQGEHAECEQQRQRIELLAAQTEETTRDLKDRRAAAHARWVVLHELEQKQEGIAIGTRDILARSVSESAAPWNSVLGLVRDLLDVPMELAPIIDAALAERGQWIAVNRLQPMLTYLDRGSPPIEGRVSFVEVENAAGADEIQAGSSDWTGVPGVYGRGDHLVREVAGAEGLAQRVLGDVWIVESLAIARRIVTESEGAVRAATLQGEVLCHGGQLFVGTLPHESSLISRKSELRQLRNEIHQLDRSLESAQQRREILAQQFSEQCAAAAGLADELQSLSGDAATRGAELSSRERDVERWQKEVTEWTRQQEALLAAQSSRTSEREATLRERDNFRAARESLAAELAREEQQATEVDELLRETRQQVRLEQVELSAQEERLRGLIQSQDRLEREQSQRGEQMQLAQQRVTELRTSLRSLTLETLDWESRRANLALMLEHAAAQSLEVRKLREELRAGRSQYSAEAEGLHHRRREVSDRVRHLEFESQKLQHQAQSLQQRIQEEYQVTLDDLLESGVSAYQDFLKERYGENVLTAVGTESPPEQAADRWQGALVPSFEEVREELESRVDRLRRKLKALGNVNSEALEHLDELEQRFTTLSGQLQDLQQAKGALEDIIRRINVESRRLFMETFEVIRKHFQELFRKLFGGGDADIILENPEDVLECGIDIVARPPGKELRSISLLSGGEKTMTAVGLLFAMFKSKPSPYCILDEVDAALDEANVDRYVTVLKEFVNMTQFVVITHRKRTMTAANVLYGVTMEQAGVSKKVSVRFEDVRDNGEIRRAA